MARWAQGTTEFVMSVVSNRQVGTKYVNLPLPIQKALGNPRYVKFYVQDDKIILEKASKKQRQK